jgi:endoglucanase
MPRLVISCGRSRIISTLLAGLVLSGCVKTSLPREGQQTGTAPTPEVMVSTPATPTSVASSSDLSQSDLLQQSWSAYRQQFIQADGRVIDLEAGDRTTSEGQAYAMLRAVLIDDPDTFAHTLAWAEANLQRRGANGDRSDSLWCWKWGKNAEGNWGTLDPNFASDGDMDAVTALILAARRWNRPDYLALAQKKLQDLWTLSTVTTSHGSEEVRYFIPGPIAAFQPQHTRLYLNPSYLGPYAFRLFAQIDSNHDWLSLVESSYRVLNQSARLSAQGLPSDWVAVDIPTGSFQPIEASNSLRTIYGFDAYRVWWRVALDAAWFNEPRAKQYLQQHLAPLQAMWRSQQKIPAQLDLQGQPLVTYESTAQYAMLYAAFRQIDPEVAQQIQQQKLIPVYHDGFWDDDAAYYTQNLSWFGLFPPTDVAANWLQP